VKVVGVVVGVVTAVVVGEVVGVVKVVGEVTELAVVEKIVVPQAIANKSALILDCVDLFKI
jgi:hypothetical protein